jgi:hypothetical protein
VVWTLKQSKSVCFPYWAAIKGNTCWCSSPCTSKSSSTCITCFPSSRLILGTHQFAIRPLAGPHVPICDPGIDPWMHAPSYRKNWLCHVKNSQLIIAEYQEAGWEIINYALIPDLSRISKQNERSDSVSLLLLMSFLQLYTSIWDTRDQQSTWDNTLLQNYQWICYETPYELWL